MIDIERLEEHLNNGLTEYVMCTANHYDDGRDHLYQPFNIDKGFVVCGWRHSSCMSTYMALAESGCSNCTQGFLTTKNRFLNREEATKLVKETGQVERDLVGSRLTSEDLW